MSGEGGYFFDTYALIEIVKYKPNYIKYANELVIITIFNIVELYYLALREFGEEKAKIIYNRFKECVHHIADDVVLVAAKLKLKNRKLSYTDCIGYAFAVRNNLLFLTGDEEFKGMPNVEFVK